MTDIILCEEGAAVPPLLHFAAKIDPDRVFFLKFILEGYDNMFITTTLDRRAGVVLIRCVQGCAQYLEDILESVREKTGFVCMEEV